MRLAAMKHPAVLIALAAVAVGTAIPAVREGMAGQKMPSPVSHWLLVRIPVGTVWSEEVAYRASLSILAAHVFFNVAIVLRTVGTFWEGLDTRPEERRAEPEYGVPDPLFGGLNAADLTEAIVEWEDRADLVYAEQVARGVLDQLTVNGDSTGPDTDDDEEA